MARKPKAAPKGDGKVQLRIVRDQDHKITPGRVLAFKAGTEPWADPEVAKALIASGAAETITAETED